jgi:hypothetical protein
LKVVNQKVYFNNPKSCILRTNTKVKQQHEYAHYKQEEEVKYFDSIDRWYFEAKNNIYTNNIQKHAHTSGFYYYNNNTDSFITSSLALSPSPPLFHSKVVLVAV